MSFEPEIVCESIQPFGVLLRLPAVASLAALPIRDLVSRHRLVLVRGFEPLSRDGFLDLMTTAAGGLDKLLKWDFGYLMEVKEDPSKANYLFTNEPVPLHWDGAFHVSPSILAFQCRDAAGEGGETLFCDTTKVWRHASSVERSEWSKLEVSLKTDKKAHYGGARRLAMVATHPSTGESILRFAERVETALNPVEVVIEGDASVDWLAELPKRLLDQSACYAHDWRKGDILLADNHALLHGRKAFGEDQRRCLMRVQIL